MKNAKCKMEIVKWGFLTSCVLHFAFCICLRADPRQESSTGITHSFLAFGAETYLLSADNKVLWSDSRNTRDGFLLPSGNLLLTITKSKEYPGGGAVEITHPPGSTETPSASCICRDSSD